MSNNLREIVEVGRGTRGCCFWERMSGQRGELAIRE